MLNQPTVGVSLKAYLTYHHTDQWLREVRRELADSAIELFVLPSFPALGVASEIVAGTGLDLGGQDVSSLEHGPATGEVPARMLAELGCRYAEVGHSERRKRCGETDEDVALKVRRSVDAGLIPIICVGEPTQRFVGEAVAFASEQLARRLALLPVDGEVVVAYEPEWAIGAAAAAEPQMVVAVTEALRRVISAAGARGRVLYGGSADAGVFTTFADTAVALEQLPDGLFVGRAALNVGRLKAIVEEVRAVSVRSAA